MKFVLWEICCFRISNKIQVVAWNYKGLITKTFNIIYSYIFNTIQYSTSFNQKIGYDELNLSRPVTVSKSYKKHFLQSFRS